MPGTTIPPAFRPVCSKRRMVISISRPAAMISTSASAMRLGARICSPIGASRPPKRVPTIETIDQVFADEQVKFLEMAQAVHSPTLGDLTILGHPVSVNGKRNPLRSAAPELGQDNAEVFTSLGFTAE